MDSVIVNVSDFDMGLDRAMGDRPWPRRSEASLVCGGRLWSSVSTGGSRSERLA